MLRGLVAVAAILMLAAPAMAAQQYEKTVWEDGAHVAPGGGLDLLELRMWEADLRDGGPGLMLRFLMESRISSLGGADSLHVNGTLLGPSDKVEVRLWTDDHASWQSDQHVFSSHTKAKGTGTDVPYPLDVRTHDVWVFVPLADLGAKVGQRIDGFVFDAYAVSDSGWSRIDTAPGGYWLLGGGTEIPEPGAVPDENALSLTAKKISSHFLGGAGHHLTATGGWEDGIVTLVIRNPYNQTDQRIDILAPQAAKPLGTIPTEVKANATVHAVYQVPRTDGVQELVWDVRGHFGGVALLELELDARAPVEGPEPEIIYIELERQDPVIDEPTPAPSDTPEPEPGPEGPGKDSPAGAVAVAAVAAALVVLRRRR